MPFLMNFTEIRAGWVFLFATPKCNIVRSVPTQAMVRSRRRRISRRESVGRISIISQWVVGLAAVSVCTQLVCSWDVCEHAVDSLPENPNTNLADGLVSIYLYCLTTTGK